MEFRRRIVIPQGAGRPVGPNDLDSEMERILKLKQDDRTKWTLYQEVQQRYLTKPKEDILADIQKRYKARAVKLLDSLNGVVTWTSDGTVPVKGREIPNSHIADLVLAYFKPAKARPIGWNFFQQILPGKVVEKASQWEEWPSKRTRRSKKN